MQRRNPEKLNLCKGVQENHSFGVFMIGRKIGCFRRRGCLNMYRPAQFPKVFVGVTAATLIYTYYFINYLFGMSDITQLEEWMRVDFKGFLVNTPGCQIPDWDPLHPSVSMYYSNLGPFKCNGNVSVVQVLDGNRLVISEEILRQHYQMRNVKDIRCMYSPILRSGEETTSRDDDFTIGKARELKNNSFIQEDCVFVQCFRNATVAIYSEYFPLIRIKAKTEEKCNARASKASLRYHLNVIIQGVDSISRLNFLRHFPKTHKFLQHELEAFSLDGYTKVGENTFPNLVPFLTGNFWNVYYDSEKNPDRYFDDLPFVWKEYAAAGYRTLLAEDSPSIATFNYLKKGFKDPPTDYYLRPYALATEVPSVRKTATKHCVQTKMEMQVVFNYSRDFVVKFKEKRFFAFSWVARLTHDVLNYAGYADLPSVKFLQDVRDSGALNNSVLIFMSDHGIRVGDILQSYLGKFEERTPFLFFVFPKWFQREMPHLFERLRGNQHRLTTPFDVHATLLDLLAILKGGDSRERRTEKGISLFEDIPQTRTCESASIPPNWCVCMRHRPVDSNRDRRVVRAAFYMVEVINNKTSSIRYLCTELKLSSVVDAYARVSPVLSRGTDKKVPKVRDGGEEKGGSATFLITVRTSPSMAVFEATVRYNSAEDTFDVLGDIGRNNMYGHQADCISDPLMKLYCYCVQQTENEWAMWYFDY